MEQKRSPPSKTLNGFPCGGSSSIRDAPRQVSEVSVVSCQLSVVRCWLRRQIAGFRPAAIFQIQELLRSHEQMTNDQ